MVSVPKDAELIKHLVQTDPNEIAIEPDYKLVEDNQVMLIRHAVTDFNVDFAKVINEYGMNTEQHRLIKIDPNYIDIRIRDEGIKQCEAGQKIVNKINFKLVFVSPMIRTLETAIHMFKSHPNKKQIKFIVCPMIKEGLNCNNDFCRSLTDVQRIINPLASYHDILIDYSMMNIYGIPDMSQFQVQVDLKMLQKCYQYINPDQQLNNFGYSTQVLQIADKEFPIRIEANKEIFQRSAIFKTFIKNYISHSRLQDQDKIGVVSHSGYLNALSAAGYDFKEDMPTNYEMFKNCQLIPWKNFMSEHKLIH